MDQKMFCYQCQETAKNTGCVLKGVCGKDAETANAMDLLLFIVRGMSVATDALRKAGQAVDNRYNLQINDALFSTITNANFDVESIRQRIDAAILSRNALVAQAQAAGVALPEHESLTWDGGREAYDGKATEVGVLAEENEDIRSLKELIVYGLKGMAAYLEHAARLGYEDEGIYALLQHIISETTVGNLGAEELTALTLKTGEGGVSAMALLDKANTERYGHPEISEVNIGVGQRPGILISGHDLHDMEQLLEQTEGTGVDVYTHGEMLPANFYPAFKKYKHFIGNYGNAWWQQREEFTSFNGPIFFTTNCIVPPTANSTYKERLFTSNATGYPGCKHIATDENGKKDFSEIIAVAKQCAAPVEIETGSIVGGFAHNQVLQLADKIVDAVKTGAIRKFVVMSGCDGRQRGRNYYTEFAQQLPKDVVILTSGCAKFRYNKLPLGDINGIPRVLDAGQCNDSYSWAVIALKLKEIFGANDINELPIAFNIAWYEQKAVIVLLALLYLGVKNIHLGPTLPGFLSPNVAKVLVEAFGIAPNGTVDEDLKKLIG